MFLNFVIRNDSYYLYDLKWSSVSKIDVHALFQILPMSISKSKYSWEIDYIFKITSPNYFSLVVRRMNSRALHDLRPLPFERKYLSDLSSEPIITIPPILRLRLSLIFLRIVR